jgi:DNA replication and repair protein RecF
MIKHGRGKPDELDFWDEKLAVTGKFLIKKRKEAIGIFNRDFSRTYQEISGGKEILKLIYKATVDEEKFEEFLVANRENEIEQEITAHGPHRDDFLIQLDGRNLATCGSRGEERSVVLALKILEIAFLTKEKEERPILLLDDIFSELDSDRRLHLAKIVGNQQTIITTTDLDHIERGLRDKAKIVELK